MKPLFNKLELTAFDPRKVTPQEVYENNTIAGFID